MTTSERDNQIETGAHPRTPRHNRRGDGPAHNTERKPVVLHGRPRTVEGEEAYLRSMMEQAATDIAAGW